jgi:predicted outer membrane repeat protein
VLLLADVHMRIHETVLRDNLATVYGGAVSVSGTTRLDVSGCLFENNTVFNNATQLLSGTGGALFADSAAPVTLSNITLVNNQAGSGGAIYAALNNKANLSSSEVVMLMQAIVMRDNTAAGQGGAVAVSGATRLHASDCLFESNKVITAASGTGGALYVDGSASVTFAKIALMDNEAGFGGAIFAGQNCRVNLSSAVNASGNHAVQSGGAVYLANFAAVSLSHGVLVKNNSARSVGGGIAAFDASTLELGPGVQVVNNTAGDEGGGIYIDEGSNLTITSLPRATGRVSVTDNVATNRGGGFCLYSDVFEWESVRAAASLNTALYGADYYVNTKRLQVVNGTTQMNIISRLDGSGVELAVNATGPGGVPSTLDVQAVLQGVPIGTLKTDDSTGLATFKVPVRKSPGRYSLTFASAKVGDTVDNATVQLNVQSCPKGDVVASTGDACITCVAGSYSLDPHNITCDKCPDNSLCPGSWTVLPLEGFWSSSPYSAQMHR